MDKMRRFSTLIAALALLLLAACSNPAKEVRPAIDAYLLSKITHPETYAPGKTTFLGEARMVSDPLAEFPCGDTLDVRVFVHRFVHADRNGRRCDNAWCFYIQPDGYIALAHIGSMPIEEVIRWK